MDADRLTKVRILNAMLGRGLGGLEQALLDYQDALRLYGHDVHALIHPDAAVRPALELRGAPWVGLANGGAWDVLAVMRLRRRLRQVRPAVCIAHGNRAMSLLRHAGADPLVAVLPNYKMKCLGAAAVFHPTEDLRQYALRQGVAEARLYHVPSMVEVPATQPERAWRQPPIIGAMGRFVAKKGFDVLIAALAQLRARNLPFHAILAGEGPERARLERQAAEAGLGAMLSFPGWVTDKAGFFAGIDVFCLPSHHEPFGIVLIEAMAQALPIVTTDSEGPSEIVRHDLDAVMVPRGDAARLANALGSLITQPDLADALAANAYQRALVRFALPRVAAMLDRAVRQIAPQPAIPDAAVT